jgi:nitroimidazol reductase NimA-like FMN-containing flavoprotein (pyridoxamine 5'-phosphate oxidase superfamily)
VSEDGFPYCIPLLYLWMSGELYVHTTSARGHLRANIENEPLFDVPVFDDPYPAE